MNYCKTTSEKTGTETFIFPDNIDPTEFSAVLDYIKYDDRRGWFRAKHTIDESGVFRFITPNSASLPEMKYIVTACKVGKQLFIFPKSINHDVMADVLHYVEQEFEGELKSFFRVPISAGFTDGKTCYGRSESLDLKSNKGDTALIKFGGRLDRA